LSAGNETLVRAASEQELLDQMCQVMVEVGGHVLAFIGGASPDGRGVELRAWAGTDDPGLRECVRTGVCHPLISAIERGLPVVVHDTARDPLCQGCGGQFHACGVKSNVILPLQSEGERLGALSIGSDDLAAFDDDEVALLTELGGDLAYGIRALRNRLGREDGLRRIQTTMEATIQALASTVEFRDPYTAGHQRRVAQLARAIGRDMGLSDDCVNGLYLAAIVHDIGKIRVPAEVLTRPGRLSKLEFDIVKTHVEAGYDILKSIDFPWPIAEIVRQHHERLNGSGYPNGVGAEALLLESRILAVADVVEAIASFRPYRPALGIDTALAEIEAGRGALFDDEIVDACIRQFREKNFEFD
jgi:putative nucleotidyltransferase with HDIG domain